MNETLKQKIAHIGALIKDNKKQVIITAAVVVLVLLLIFIPLFVFPGLKTKNKSSEVNQSAVSSETSSLTSSTEASLATSSEEASSVTQESAAQSSNPSTAAAPSVSVPKTGVQKTGYAPLDALTSKILSNITNSGMSSNAKLNAIYNHVKKKMKYNMFPPATEGTYEKLKALGYSDYDSSQMALAYDAATYYQGVCDNYAALTMVLARAAGIPLFQSGGLSSTGSSHAWNILIVNGEKYLVDTNYGIFMKQFSKSGFTEQMDGRNFFNNFRTSAPQVEEQKISWMFNAGSGAQRFIGNNRGEITKTAIIEHPLYPAVSAIYPEPVVPTVTCEGKNNTFSARVISNGAVIENLKSQSGAEQMYFFSWYPPNPGSYVIEITAKSDGIFTGHFIINVKITG